MMSVGPGSGACACARPCLVEGEENEGRGHFVNAEDEENNVEEIEKALLKKVDRKMSVLVLIYILNCKIPISSA